MEPTVQQFRDVFEEFADVKSGRLEYYLDQAKRQVSESEYEDNYAHAVYLRLAHSLTLMDPSNAPHGSLTAEKAGDVSYSYSAIVGNELLGQTKYGQEFIQLLKENIVAVTVL